MEKKYYDLIISLIKNHRKYSGLESILEDIANDVYERAKVVISSVPNEDVITAYLSKVVSTSIVTVPKKMNFNVNTRHKVISTVLPAVEEVLPIVVDEAPEEIVTEEISIEESVQEFEEENLCEEEPIVIETLEGEVSESIPEELVEEMVEEATEEYLEEEVLVENSEDTVEIEESIVTETVDVSLVDKMINGVSSAPEDFVEINSDEEIQEESDIYESLEELEPTEENLLSDDFIAVEENIEALDVVSEDTQEDLEIIDEEISEDINEKEELVLEPEAENEAEILDLEDTMPAFDIEEIAESVQEISGFEILEAPSEDTSEEILSLDVEVEDLNDELIVNEEITSANAEVSIALPSLKCFEYNPKEVCYDVDEIFSELQQLEEKYPEKKILLICDLKYNKNLSIAEIVEQVGLSEDFVLEVLNEIIDTVKDYN